MAVNTELEGIWKDEVVASFKYCPSISLERLRNAMRNL
jgi:hypothetical protein